jgi:sodium/potassium-transporting ATPase subunit alpha
MDVAPRPRSERLLSGSLLVRTYLFLGLNSALLAMGGFFLYLFANGWTWGVQLDWTSPLLRSATTVTLAGIVLAQVANVFACRSGRLSIFSLGWWTNPLIFWGIAVELTLLMIITYTPVGNKVFGTSPLPLWIFGPLTLGAFACLLAEEARKLIADRLLNRPSLNNSKRRSS